MAEAPNKIAHLRKRRKMTQQMLASRLGVHVITVSNLERGQLHLSVDWMEKLAEALQVEPNDLLIKSKARSVFVGGFLTQRFTYYFEEDQKFWPATVRYSDLTNDIPRWFYVLDNDLYPVLRRGDVVRGVVMNPEDPEHRMQCFGKLCCVKSDNNLDMVGFVDRGPTVKTINVQVINAPAQTGVQPTILILFDQVLYQPDLPASIAMLNAIQDEISKSANKPVD